MSAQPPALLALDFDGVICDGLIEYFQTAWKTYCQFWSPAVSTPPEGAAERFYRLRPVVETGWEMPVLVQLVLSDLPETKIVEDWSALCKQVLHDRHLQPAELAAALDQNRDESIATDLEGWLASHRFYPGIVERLTQIIASPIRPLIVTTKEKRFVQQLLRQQNIELPDDQIWGKERQKPKPQILSELAVAYDRTLGEGIWFVEDRLKALQAVQAQPNLAAATLYLADWGYNLPAEREIAKQDSRIHLLSLSQFSQDFSHWQ